MVLDIRTRNMSGHQQVRNDQEIPSAISSSLGGWWVRPSNWASNTVIAIGGMATVLYAVWKISADREVCWPVPSTITTTDDIQKGSNSSTESIHSFNAGAWKLFIHLSMIWRIFWSGQRSTDTVSFPLRIAKNKPTLSIYDPVSVIISLHRLRAGHLHSRPDNAIHPRGWEEHWCMIWFVHSLSHFTARHMQIVVAPRIRPYLTAPICSSLLFSILVILLVPRPVVLHPTKIDFARYNITNAL